MKLSTWACAWALSSALFTGNLMAQQLRQPFSVRPAGFDYNRYLQDSAAQPAPVSQEPAPVQDAAPVVASPATVASPAAACNTCQPASACAPCDSGCGLGLGGLGSFCNLGEPYALKSALLPATSAWNVGGWTQFGYHDEANITAPQFNVHPDNFNLHQQWFFLEKKLAADEGNYDWGFRADFMYGVDAADTQAFGNTADGNGPRGFDNGWDHGIYGYALPQLYAEVGKGDWSLKLGHFYTIVGYESVMAPSNFFYSHANTMYNSEPFTHTGALLTYNVSDSLSVWAGWSLGWDTGFDQFGDGSSFLGGFTKTISEDMKLIYASVVGDFGWMGSNAYVHSVILDTALTDKLQYVFQTDFLRVDSTQHETVAILNYLFYTVNDCTRIGTRVEWWQDDSAGLGGISNNEATFGVNYKPHANFIIRPEVRQNWIPAAGLDQTIFGVDVIATY